MKAYKPLPKALSPVIAVTEHAWKALQNTKGNGLVIECGVYEGVLSAYMNIMLRRLYDHEFLRQVAIDTFDGFPDYAELGDLYNKMPGMFAPPNADKVISELVRLGILVFRDKVEVALPKVLVGNRVAFVWLDFDLATPTKAAIECMEDHFLVGARVGFHDYGADAWKITGVVNISYFMDKTKWREVYTFNKRKPNTRIPKCIFFEKVA